MISPEYRNLVFHTTAFLIPSHATSLTHDWIRKEAIWKSKHQLQN